MHNYVILCTNPRADFEHISHTCYRGQPQANKWAVGCITGANTWAVGCITDANTWPSGALLWPIHGASGE